MIAALGPVGAATKREISEAIRLGYSVGGGVCLIAADSRGEDEVRDRIAQAVGFPYWGALIAKHYDEFSAWGRVVTNEQKLAYCQRVQNMLRAEKGQAPLPAR